MITGARRRAAAGDPPLLLCPARPVEVAGLQPEKIYRVAFPTDFLWRFSQVAQMAPRNYCHTDLGVAEALERFLAETGQ
jgi:hypothetical protein